MVMPGFRSGWFQVLLWGFAFVVLLASDGRDAAAGDAARMCNAAQSWLRGDGLAVDAGVSGAQRGPDGRFHPPDPWPSVLQCVPALGLRDAARGLWPQQPHLSRLAFALVPNALGATLALGLFQLAIALQGSLAGALIVALGVLFTTPLWAAARTLQGETLQALLMIWALLMIVRSRGAGRGSTLAAGCLCGLALNANLLLAFLPLAWLVDAALGRRRSDDAATLDAIDGSGRARSRSASSAALEPADVPPHGRASVPARSAPAERARLAAFALSGLIAGLYALAWYNRLRFGSVLELGHDDPRDEALGFHVPLLAGLQGLLFSSGKSLFLYAPLTAAGAWLGLGFLRARPRDAVLLSIPLAGALLIVACWWDWAGDPAWGPRWLTPFLALACLPALPLLSRPGWPRRVLLLSAASGLLVQIAGISIEPRAFIDAARKPCLTFVALASGKLLRDGLLAIHFVPEFSPLRGHAWLLMRYVEGEPWGPDSDYPWRRFGVAGYRPLRDPTPQALDFWFTGEPSTGVIVAECALIALALALGISLYRMARQGVAR
jgi:hypothetical protein